MSYVANPPRPTSTISSSSSSAQVFLRDVISCSFRASLARLLVAVLPAVLCVRGPSGLNGARTSNPCLHAAKSLHPIVQSLAACTRCTCQADWLHTLTSCFDCRTFCWVRTPSRSASPSLFHPHTPISVQRLAILPFAAQSHTCNFARACDDYSLAK